MCRVNFVLTHHEATIGKRKSQGYQNVKMSIAGFVLLSLGN